MAVNMTSRTLRAHQMYLADATPDKAQFAMTVAAAASFIKRRARIEHPIGTFDKAKRFWLSENSHSHVREPSRAWPHSQMLHGRTLAHCAYLGGCLREQAQVVVSLLDGLIETGAWSAARSDALAVVTALAV